jgi:glycosyltransferase involved in cell wall biosynthesis
MIYYLPLEHIERRYTALLDKQLMREFKRQGKKFYKIDGELLTSKIETGAFLDSEGTNYYKFSQLQQVCQLFKEGKIKQNDTFFISDLWFPGIESIKYMAYFRGIRVNIKGLLHAGSFTETDYVRGLEDWVKWVEKGWFHSFDKIFLGSNFIKQELIEKERIIDFKKLEVTGLPFIADDLYKKVEKLSWDKKQNIVVFAGRLDDEKQPWQFDKVMDIVRNKFPELQVVAIKTLEKNLSKIQYLKLLAKSKVFFSSSLQENFGYAALEAAAYDCNLVLPNRLVYPEFYPKKCLYNNLEQAAEMIENKLWCSEGMVKYALKHSDNIKNIIKKV